MNQPEFEEDQPDFGEDVPLTEEQHQFDQDNLQANQEYDQHYEGDNPEYEEYDPNYEEHNPGFQEDNLDLEQGGHKFDQGVNLEFAHGEPQEHYNGQHHGHDNDQDQDQDLLEEHHDDGSELPCSPAPPTEIKLFIARIPKTYEEEDLHKLFDDFGLVKEVIVIRDKETNTHKNCAFVRMASISQADAAIRSLNNQCVVDSALGPVQIRYATGEPERLGFTQMVGQPGVDDAKLFVGSIPRNMTEEELSDYFKEFGTILDVFVMKDLNSGGTKGCGFVRMKYKEQALYAIQMLHGKKTMEGCSRPLEVRFALTKSSQHQSHHGQIGFRSKRNPPPPYPNSNSNSSFSSSSNFNSNSNYSHSNYSSSHYSSSNSNPNYGYGHGHGYGSQGGSGGGGSNSNYNNQNYKKKRNFGGQKYGGFTNYNNGNPRQAGPWKEYISPDGRFYYYNVEDGSTQWEVPREFLHQNPNSSPNSYNFSNYDFNGHNYANQSEEASLFVFHIPQQWNNSDLLRTFTPFGRVVSARIAFDRATNRSKGYAFVSYDNPESATQAVANMNGFSILGKKLKVTYKTHRPTPY